MTQKNTIAQKLHTVMTDRKQKEQKAPEIRYNSQWFPLGDLSSVRFHFPKYPSLFQITTPAKGHLFPT